MAAKKTPSRYQFEDFKVYDYAHYGGGVMKNWIFKGAPGLKEEISNVLNEITPEQQEWWLQQTAAEKTSYDEWTRLSQYLQAGAKEAVDWPSTKVVDGKKTITIALDANGDGHFLHKRGEIRRMKETFPNLNITKMTKDQEGAVTIVTDLPAALTEADQ